MKDAHKIKIGKVDESVVSAMNNTMDSLMESNADLRATATNIEKRGFTYTGDTNQGWGLRNAGFGLHGITGFTGTSPYYGRGPELMGFNLQPFGLGVNGLLGGSSISPSIFSGTGAGVRYSKSTHIAHLKMALCVEAYKGFGILKNIIDLMCNFASEDIKIIHSSAAIQKFYEEWWIRTGMDGRVKDIFRYYYKFGNVFIYTTMGKIDSQIYRKMKSKAAKNADLKDHNDPNSDKRQKFIDKEAKDPIEEKEIPWRYTLLNPFQMDVRGGKYFGESEWVFIPDEEMRAKIDSSTTKKQVDVLDESDVGLPPEFQKLTQDGNAIVLDQTKLWTLHYMKDDHEDWADPMAWPVMNDIMYKQQLRAMDMSVANSVINAITIYKLGNIKEGFVAPKEHYRKFSEMLRTPTYTHNIVWNDAISIESNYPPIEKILGIDKYKSVDRDILAGLGVPGILVNGAEGGSFSNAFLQVRTLLERLEEGRRTVLEWIDSQLRMIAQVMGHREIPTVKFGQMSLRDEQAEKNLIIQLLDRNIISAERVHEVFDIETDIEVERMKREKAISDKEDIMLKFGPFKDPMNMMDTEEQMDVEHQNELENIKLQNKNKPRSQSPNQIKKNGRPSGTKGIPQKKKRETKPKGMGLASYDKIKSLATSAYFKTEKTISDLFLEARQVKYKKQLSKEDRTNLSNLIFTAYSNVNIYEDISKDYIANILKDINVNLAFYENFEEMPETATLEDKRQAAITAMARYIVGDLNE